MPGTATGRRLLGCLCIICTVALACAMASASASAAALPPEGIFENCNLTSQMPTCVQRLQVMHQGGFQIVVIPTSYAAPSVLADYAAAANSLGMSVMWEIGNQGWWSDPATSTSMSGYYGGFAALCGCEENGPLLAYLAHWLGQLPGTYGYYAADDTMLGPGDQAGMASYVAAIKQADPAHTLMIASADENQTSTYVRMADVIGTEIYPFTTDSLMPVTAHQDEWDAIAQWAGDAQQAAGGAGKESAFILQAFTWGDNLSDGQTIGACTTADTPLSCYGKLQYPTSAEQLQLRNEILLHARPKLILWWSFPGTDGDVTGDTYSIYPSGAAAAVRWSGLAAAVQAPFPGTNPSAPVAGHGLGAHLARAVRVSRPRVAVRAKHRRRHRRHHRHRHKKRR
jgi:hypothetical protein